MLSFFKVVTEKIRREFLHKKIERFIYFHKTKSEQHKRGKPNVSKKARFLRSQMSKEHEKNIKKAIQVNARLQSSWFFISYKYLLYMPSIQHIYLSLLLNFNSSQE